MQNELSQAVVLFLGFGSAPSPRHDSDCLAKAFGTVRGAELETEVDALLTELGKINVDWSVHSLVSSGKIAADYMRAGHPDLSDAALEALAWKFTFDWR